MNSSYLLLNDLRFHYLQWNRAGGDRAIVCHHGLASNAHIWDLAAPALAGHGFSVYAPEARGHGLSDKPDDGYDIDTVTTDLAAFIDACQLERPVLAGHSWGANVVLHYAAKFPVGPRAPAAIVLIDGGIVQLDEIGISWEEMERNLTPPRLAGTPVDEFRAQLRQWTAHWNAPEQALDVYLNSFDISEDDRISPRLTLERHMRIARSIWDFKVSEHYARVRCPVLLIPARMANENGADAHRHAASVQRGLESAGAAIRDLRIHWMEDTIHDVPLHRPVELADAIDKFVNDPARDHSLK